ncbi:MAG: right-handed parallel beta-helix repeat-containing protein [Candidatus Thermoplasmatota archaeon]|nr:right-handed parallel beta-helix repeat-containing protein [Candidatus Thermoplasmatota archaeon]
MKRNVVALLIIPILIFTTLVQSVDSEEKETVVGSYHMNISYLALEPTHDPIFINNDTSLLDNATKYGWGGSGSPSDPFIISNIIIDANQTAYGIRIWNTSGHVLLQNTTIFNSGTGSTSQLHSSLDLFNVSNMILDSCKFFQSENGITSLNSSFKVMDTTISNVTDNGIYARNSYVSLERMLFHNCTNYGYHATGSGSINVSTTNILYGSYGLFLQDLDINVVDRCMLDGLNSYGIYISGGDSGNISNTNINGSNSAIGISRSSNFVMINVSIDNCNTGIYATYSQDIHLGSINTTFTWSPIEFRSVDRYSISGCSLNGGTTGISISSSDQGSIIRNNVQDMKNYGMYIYSAGSGLVLRDDVISQCSGAIYIRYSSYVVVSNISIGNSTFGLKTYYTQHITIEKCTISNIDQEGILLERSNSPNIDSNIIKDCRINGIKINNFNEGTISENRIDHSQNSIEIDYCDDMVITENTMIGGSTGLIARGGDRSVISGNSISGASSNGMVLSECHDNIVEGNLYMKNIYFGLNLFTCNDINIWNNTFAYNNGANRSYRSSSIQASDNRADNRWSWNRTGNHWTDWTDPDIDENGIVDDHYSLSGLLNIDEFPVTEPFHIIVPAPPGDLSANSSNISIELEWELPSTDGGDPISGLVLYRSNGTGYRYLTSLGPDVTGFVDLNIKDGVTYYYRIRSVNSIGESPNSNTASGNVDRTVPKINIGFPIHNSYLNMEEFLLEWSITDSGKNIDNSSYRIDDGPWVEVGSETSCIIHIKGNGPHFIDVRAYDRNYNWNSTRVDLTIDMEIPEIEIITPADGSSTNMTSVSFEWSATDQYSGIEHFEIRWDEIYWIEKGLNTGTVINGLSPGKHTFHAKAVDMAGNQVLSMINVTVDTDRPFVEVTSPEEGLFTNDRGINIKWWGSDPSSSELAYFISIDKGGWEYLGNRTDKMIDLPDEGGHLLEISVRDPAGNMYSDMVNITLDMTAPQIVEFNPEAGTGVEITDEIFVVFNEMMRTQEVWFNIKGKFSFMNWYGTKLLLSPEEGLQPGMEYTVSVSGSDLAGNSLEPFTWTFSTNGTARVSGSIIDENDKLLSGVKVSIGPDRSTMTDTSGSFLLIVPWGNCTISAEKDGYEKVTRSFYLDPGEKLDLSPIKLLKKIVLGSLIGRVIDEDGDPLLGVIVNTLDGVTDTTDENGRFSMDLSPGEHRITFSRDLFGSKTLIVVITEDETTDLNEIVLNSTDEGKEKNYGIDMFQVQIGIFVLILIIGLTFLLLIKRRKGSNMTIEEE